MATTRRDFLRWAAAGAAAGASAPLWARAPRTLGAPARAGGGRRLVMIFLDGGNDGLNTVVPVDDDRYHRARPRLRIHGRNAPRLDAHTVLHPALSSWRGLYEEGNLCVVRDVGCARLGSSHAECRDLWHRGRREPGSADPDRPGRGATARGNAGWLGRAAARVPSSPPPVAAVGAARPPLLLAGAPRATALGGLPARPRGDVAGGGYPSSGLAGRLRRIARLVRAEDGPAVTWTRLGGFDTHAAQAATHAALLARLGDATAAFLRDLRRDGSDARTLVLIYSEFGRSVAENAAGGTDHGAAGPVLALGGGVRGGVRGGLIGAPPELDQRAGTADAGDTPGAKGAGLHAQHDFRAVFSEALEDWLGWPAAGLFDGGHADGRSRVGFLAG